MIRKWGFGCEKLLERVQVSKVRKFFFEKTTHKIIRFLEKAASN